MRGPRRPGKRLLAVVGMHGYKFMGGGADMAFRTFGRTRRQSGFLKVRALLVDACRQIFSGGLVDTAHDRSQPTPPLSNFPPFPSRRPGPVLRGR